MRDGAPPRWCRACFEARRATLEVYFYGFGERGPCSACGTVVEPRESVAADERGKRSPIVEAFAGWLNRVFGGPSV